MTPVVSNLECDHRNDATATAEHSSMTVQDEQRMYELAEIFAEIFDSLKYVHQRSTGRMDKAA
jgi:hypothetical protein